MKDIDDPHSEIYRHSLEKELMFPLTPNIIASRVRARAAFGKYNTASWQEHAATKNRINEEREFVQTWLEYVKACKAAGYCHSCEKSLSECKCATYA